MTPALIFCLAQLVIVLAVSPSSADPGAGSGASVVELKAAAYDAQQKADAAAADAEQARERVAEAERATPASEGDVDELRREVEAARQDARAARAEAERASSEAEAVRRELAEHKAKEEKKYSRPGIFIGALGFHVNEHFDADVGIDDTKGAGLVLGYRITDRVSVSGQFDKLEDFDVTGPDFSGDLDTWSATLNAKLYLFTRAIQPYVGFGIGAIHAKLELQDDQGQKYSDSETAVLLKLNGGFDLYLTENLAITADAAIHLPGGELSDLPYSTLGAGLKIRF